MTVMDNPKYREMELVPGEYVPETGLEYSASEPLTRMIPVKKVREYKNDDSYPYLNDSLSFKINRFLTYCVVEGPLRLMCRVKYGLKVEGRENLRKHSDVLKGSVISVCNHCFPFDAICLYYATRRRMYVPMLADLFTGPNWWLLTYYGGIPLADGTMSATKKFNAAFDELNARGKWIHIFAEARSWPFYKPLRPFQKGAFTMAYKWGCPVLPMNISYRPRTGIYKLFGNSATPLVTVRIGEPVIPDKTQPRKTEVERLLRQTHAAVCKLGGIIKNPWPAIWNED